MTWTRVLPGFVAMAVVLGLAASAGAATIVLPRPGQIGIGLQGQFGALSHGGSLGGEFGTGGGYALRLRYRMRYERAFGLSFENQTFSARSDARFEDLSGARIPADSSVAPKNLTLTTAGVELCQMFGTRTRTTRMLSVGVGLAKVQQQLNNSETAYPLGGDGVFISAGAGIERFFFRSWAYDLSMRYFAVFQNGEVNHDAQASAGLIFYASY